VPPQSEEKPRLLIQESVRAKNMKSIPEGKRLELMKSVKSEKNIDLSRKEKNYDSIVDEESTARR